jgi:hypothetical protein
MAERNLMVTKGQGNMKKVYERNLKDSKIKDIIYMKLPRNERATPEDAKAIVSRLWKNPGSMVVVYQPWNGETVHFHYSPDTETIWGITGISANDHEFAASDFARMAMEINWDLAGEQDSRLFDVRSHKPMMVEELEEVLENERMHHFAKTEPRKLVCPSVGELLE